MYGFLADALVCVHVLYCAYVVLGQLVVIVAAPFRWEWARNPWFRYSHLLAIGIVVLEEGMNWRCPLTVWEEQLRALSGATVEPGATFMGQLAHTLLFGIDLPGAVFTTLHVAMGVLVLQGVVMFPPRWFWKTRGLSSAGLTAYSSTTSSSPSGAAFITSRSSTVA